MAVVFKLPDLGENIESAEVVSVAAAVGDMIEADQTIIEVETDKAVTDVPAPIGGKLIELAVAVGDKLSIGDIIAKIEEMPGGSVPVAAQTGEARGGGAHAGCGSGRRGTALGVGVGGSPLPRTNRGPGCRG